MSEDKTQQDEPVEAQREDDEPDVEAHRMKARRLGPVEDESSEPGARAKRPSR